MTELTRLHREIGDRMIAGNSSFPEIEQFIDARVRELALNSDLHACLWLYAWSHLPPAQQRHEALQTLHALAA